MAQRNILTISAAIFIILSMFGFGFVLGLNYANQVQKSTILPTKTSVQTASGSAEAEVFYQQQTENIQEAVVTRIIDGDTIEINGNQIVRYIGIDTPELNGSGKKADCYAIEAKNLNEELVGGKKVWLEKDISETDRYGRLLRYVWSGPLMINEYLVSQGYATITTYPPDVKYQDLFLQTQQQARSSKLGLWSSCP